MVPVSSSPIPWIASRRRASTFSILNKGGILVAFGLKLPAFTSTPRRPALPVILQLLARNLLFWTGRRTTF